METKDVTSLLRCFDVV